MYFKLERSTVTRVNSAAPTTDKYQRAGWYRNRTSGICGIVNNAGESWLFQRFWITIKRALWTCSML